MFKCASGRVWFANLMACFALLGCGGSDEGSGSGAVTSSGGTGGAAASGAGGSGGAQVASGGVGGGGGSAGMMITSTGGSSGVGAGGSAGTLSPSGGSGGVMSGGMGGSGGDDMMVPSGPVDGDPTKPMVEIDGVPCGAPTVGFGGSPPTVTIGGRDVVVAYPCMNEGAQVTFFLFIHGTLQDAQKVPFTMAAFPVHEFVDSHNFIVVVPKAIDTQWGRMDDGQDLPHLHEVIDWVYATFGEKVDIRSMWASGGSWGAFYLSSTFACDPRFENRLKGVRMVVGTPCPSCTNRLACIVAEQELEEGMGMPLTPDQQEMKSNSNIGPFAMQHGCDAKMKMPDLGPVRHWTWPNCDPGFVHSYYLGPGQHADPWNDPTALEYMVNEIKSIEQ